MQVEQKLTGYTLCFIERKMRPILRTVYTLIKIFLIYKEIQKGAVAKSNMRKGFLIYEEMCKYLIIYEEAVIHT